MGTNSTIEWTTHTFNPWWGCQRVSPGCVHCYAETLAKRYGHQVWGPTSTTERRMMSANYWKQPYKWEKAAAAGGTRPRVFCASMADVFEDHPEVWNARRDLFGVIEETPHLDWLLLTKRPENIARLLPSDWLKRPRNNVWLGTSVEDQRRADERIPQLLKVPAKVRFLSCEPLLGAVDISKLLVATPCQHCGNVDGEAGRCYCGVHIPSEIHWVICGGESGHGARPMHPDWARSLRDQCEAAGVAYFFKQWGEYVPVTWRQAFEDPKPALTVGRDGSSVFTQVGHLAGFVTEDEVCMERAGKKTAGRMLDGRTWDEVPG